MCNVYMFFKRSEFACKCGCGFDTVDYQLMDVLYRLRLYFDSPVIINSGCRCETHNRDEGGGDKSQHLYGRAADITVKGIDPKVVYDTLDRWYPDKFGIGLYISRVHIDTRDNKIRWNST